MTSNIEQTKSLLEQLLEEAQAQTGVLRRIESLLDDAVMSLEEIQDTSAETAHYTHGVIWRIYAAIRFRRAVKETDLERELQLRFPEP